MQTIITRPQLVVRQFTIMAFKRSVRHPSDFSGLLEDRDESKDYSK